MWLINKPLLILEAQFMLVIF